MEAIVNNLIKAIGWSIFHSLWQGAIIYGLLILAVAVMPRLNAKIKHNLAYSAMCFMFAGFCITFFSIFQSYGSPGPTQASNIPQLVPASADQILTLPQKLLAQTEHSLPYLVSLYAIGLCFQLFILSAGYRKLLLLKQADKVQVPGEWQEKFEQLIKNLGLRRTTSFFLSASINVPLVIGYFKPMVLFPISLASQLDIQQVEAILIHELSHIRRNDYVLNLIKTAVETILFFNPFVWLSGRHIMIEREHACDDLVLKFTGTPVTYAHALLKLEILKDKTTPALSMAATGGTQHLYQRIKRITDMKTNYMNAKQQFFAITLTVATVVSLAWVGPGKTENRVNAKKSADKKMQFSVSPAGAVLMDRSDAKATVALSPDKSIAEDTTKKKKQFKIITVDAKGTTKEYQSVRDMPDSLKQEVISDTFFDEDDFKFDFKLDSVTNIAMTYINSPEFKRVINNAQAQAKAIALKFNSPEWKKQQVELQKNAMMMSKKFNSEEMKKMQKDMQKMGEEMKKKFDSPEFRKQMEDLKKLQASPEYKQLQEKFSKEFQKLKEEKGLKSDLKFESPDQEKHIMFYKNDTQDEGTRFQND